MREVYQQPQTNTLKSDIEIFAKAYFNIELTKQQMEYIRALAAPHRNNLFRISRRAGTTTADKVWRLYIQEGLKPGGRARLPMYDLPVREKIKGVTQEGKVLRMIKRPGGAFNFELSRIALKYTSVISSLRKDGHEIVAERQYLKNGRASNTFKYRLAGQ